MSFWNIFTPAKVADAVINTGDAIFYTDEEKAIAAQKILDAKLKFIGTNGNFQVAQRMIAFAFTLNFLLAFWVGVSIYIYGTKQMLDGYMQLIIAFNLGWIMLAIITWYFGGGFMNSLQQNKKDK